MRAKLQVQAFVQIPCVFGSENRRSLQVAGRGNIDFEKRELTIFSEKRPKPDSMINPHELYLDTIEFIKSNISAIKESGSHIFFKGHCSHNKEDHIDANYTRKIFR